MDVVFGRLSREFHRYLWAGSLAFAGDLTVLVLLTEVGRIDYLTASAAAFGVGLLLSYGLNIGFVFSNRRYGNTLYEPLIFCLLAGLGLVINQLTLWSLVELAALHYTLAKCVAVVTVFIGSFALKKSLLF